mgnify:CR=1 FL=1
MVAVHRAAVVDILGLGLDLDTRGATVCSSCACHFPCCLLRLRLWLPPFFEPPLAPAFFDSGVVCHSALIFAALNWAPKVEMPCSNALAILAHPRSVHIRGSMCCLAKTARSNFFSRLLAFITFKRP